MNFKIHTPALSFRNNRTRRAQTNAIVVHHLAGDLSVQQTHEVHIRKGWSGIGYNFHIAKDGTISAGRGMEFVGAHTEGRNSDTIGIGVSGNYHTGAVEMPDIQFNALVWLIRHLREVYGDIRIFGHRDLAATACPGQHFPLDEVKKLEFRGEVAKMNIEFIRESNGVIRMAVNREFVEQTTVDTFGLYVADNRVGAKRAANLLRHLGYGVEWFDKMAR